MKKFPAQLPLLFRVSFSKGFTLIELLVVIAILGVLAVALLTVLDPIDKINSVNDASVISTVTDMGRANDRYAVNRNGYYANGTTLGSVLSTLQAAGESKSSSYTPPSGYGIVTAVAPAGCTSGTTCTDYVFAIATLKSKKYTSTSRIYYMVVNGRGCAVIAGDLPNQADLEALNGASSGPAGSGACPP